MTENSKDGRWVFSHDLQVGDVLVTRDGDDVVVESVETREVEKVTVFNLTVEGHQNYFVSSFFVLVHNISYCAELAKYATKPQNLIDLAVDLGYKASAVHAHHIVMKKGTIWGRKWTQAAQKLLKDNKIELLIDEKSFAKAVAQPPGNQLDNMCYALNYQKGIHSTKYQRFIAEGLLKAKDTAIKQGRDVQAALKSKLAEWKDEFEQGKDFWNKVI